MIVVAAIIAAAITVYAADVKCPIDNYSMYFTGQTQIDTVSGKLLYEYKCPMGHVTWVVQ
jgi:hypothetical protein